MGVAEGPSHRVPTEWRAFAAIGRGSTHAVGKPRIYACAYDRSA